MPSQTGAAVTPESILTSIYSNKRALLATTILGVSFLFPAGTAEGQERIRERVVETERVLNTVQVTAQKRSEDLQDVPIAIQAFDAEPVSYTHLTLPTNREV